MGTGVGGRLEGLPTVSALAMALATVLPWLLYRLATRLQPSSDPLPDALAEAELLEGWEAGA